MLSNLYIRIISLPRFSWLASEQFLSAGAIDFKEFRVRWLSSGSRLGGAAPLPNSVLVATTKFPQCSRRQRENLA